MTIIFHFSQEELDLLIRSLEHSIESGQFFFNMDDTEKLKVMLDSFKKA